LIVGIQDGGGFVHQGATFPSPWKLQSVDRENVLSLLIGGIILSAVLTFLRLSFQNVVATFQTMSHDEKNLLLPPHKRL